MGIGEILKNGEEGLGAGERELGYLHHQLGALPDGLCVSVVG